MGKQPINTIDRSKNLEIMREMFHSALVCILGIMYKSLQRRVHGSQYMQQEPIEPQHFPCAQATYVSETT